MENKQTKTNIENKLRANELAMEGLRKITPEIVQMVGKQFDSDLARYNSCLGKSDIVFEKRVEDELYESAQFYLDSLERHEAYLPNPLGEDFLARKRLAESTLNKINRRYPSAMWDVQPGA